MPEQHYTHITVRMFPPAVGLLMINYDQTVVR